MSRQSGILLFFSSGALACVAWVADNALNVNMGFTDDDRILIENLYIFNGYGAKKLIKEFPDKGWALSSLNKLLK